MTARYDDDRLLSAWLHDVAPAREPGHLLGEVLARTARTRRRPAWRNPERWNPMSAITSRLTPATQVPWRLLAVAAALILALALGIALLAGGALKPKAPPFGPAGNGPIFYSQGGELYARSADGAVRPVISGPTTDWAPVLSPDGTRLSFLREATGGYDVWAAFVDGSNVRRLDMPGPDVGWFEWSPKGDEAVVLINSQPTTFYLVPADGGPPTSRDLGVIVDQAIWRPTSGAQLAFLGKDFEDEHGIYLVGRDGTNLVRLDLDPGYRSDLDYAVNKSVYFWTMSWAASGDRFLYTQLEPLPGSPAGPGFRNHLATVDASGNVVSDEIIEFDPATDDEFSATWLPGSDGIVFQSVEGSRHWMSYATVGPSGFGRARDLGIEANDWINFQVSPDGTTMLATMPAQEGAAPVVYLVDLASGVRTEVAIGEDASWQRLGR